MNRNIVYLVAIVLLFLAAIYAVYSHVQIARLKAFHDCASISKFEKRSNDGTTISYPLAEVYDPCVQHVTGK